MSNAMLGYLLFCAGIGILFAGALSERPVGERIMVGLGFPLILAGIGFFVSGVWA